MCSEKLNRKHVEGTFGGEQTFLLMSAILPRQMLHWLFSELLSSIFGESPIQQRQIQLRFYSRQVLSRSRQVKVRFETRKMPNHMRQVQI